MFRFISIFFCLTLILFGTLTTDVLAQTGAGIGIKPANIDEMMDPGQSRDFTISIANLSGQDQTYYLYTRDITGATDTGAPIFASENQEVTGLEMKQWITLVSNSVTVPVGTEQALALNIKVPDNASPGTHFAGIFISAEPPEFRESGAAVGYEVANIISIRVSGEVDESASIRQFSTDNYFYGKPEVNFYTKIENSGNTLIRPNGPLMITNMFGQTVGEIIFNEKKGGVFPGNSREFTTEWKGKPPGFGRYEASVSPVFGEAGAHQTLYSTVSFWILPMNIILPALGVLAFLLLISYLFARLYIKRTLAQYSMPSTRRLVRRQKGGNSAFLFVFMVMAVVTIIFLLVLVALFA